MANTNSNLVNKIAYAALGVCTSLVFLIVSFFVFLIVFPIRQVVKFLLRHRYKNLFELMEPTDAVFSMNGDGCSLPMTACFLAQMSFGKENLEKLRKKLEHNILSNCYKKLQLVPCIKFGFCCWEDVGTFDILNHVKLCPGKDDWNRVYSETEFMSILNKAINIPISNGEKKPKWEVLVIPQVRAKINFSSSSQTNVAVIIRMCHGYMDGNFYVKFIKKCILDDVEVSFTPVLRSNRNPWNFPRKATFHLKLFAFGILDGLKNADFIKENNILDSNDGVANSRQAFIGKVKLASESLRKIREASNCGTTAVFSTAFITALKNFGESKGIDIPRSVKVALTRMVPGTQSNGMPQNRFGVFVRHLSAHNLKELSKDRTKQLLSSAHNLIHLTPNEEHEPIANFYLTKLVGFLPNMGIRVLTELSSKFTCLISYTPASDQVLKFQGELVTSLFGVPPNTHASCYSLGVSNYEGSFYATLFVKKSSLVQSQHEFQQLISEFQDCISLLENYACES